MRLRIILAGILLLVIWLTASFLDSPPARPVPETASAPVLPTASVETKSTSETLPGDLLLGEFGTASQTPLEDLRRIRAVTLGYFSVVKDVTRFPIGGNEDLTACLLGQNADRQPFLSPQHPAIRNGMLIDRWGTAISVHPEAAQELTLRSAGPDRKMFTDDDLVLNPNGTPD